MGDSLRTGLVLAAVSGLTYVAYRHPAGYRRLGVIIMAAVTLGGLFFVSLQLGRIVAIGGDLFSALSRTPKESLESVSFEIRDLYSLTRWFPEAYWLFVAVVAYLGFLAYLPSILGLSSGVRATSDLSRPPSSEAPREAETGQRPPQP